ncbi:MAG: DNA cytosine methyltransferase [Planctomycetota bacterium]
MKALEMFAGLGGFAFAAGHAMEKIVALDVSAHLVSLYAQNHSHHAVQANIESLDPDALRSFDADFWWMSPPCQPYTVRGNQRDLEDPRALSFKRLLAALPVVRPACLGLENVAGFQESQAREALLRILAKENYTVMERILCPTELGIPNRRPRYYLAAVREGGLREFRLQPVGRDLLSYLDPDPDETLIVPPRIVEKYGRAFDIVRPGDPEAVATCFTSAYGRSWSLSGSYLEDPNGRLRLFSPKEVLRLLHFPDSFSFPSHVTRRQQWKYAGNSLNVAAVREVLHVLGVPMQGEA